MSTGLRVSTGRVANRIILLQKSTFGSADRMPKGAAALDTGASGDAARFCRHAGPACLKCLIILKSRRVRQKAPSAISTNHKTQQSEMNPDC